MVESERPLSRRDSSPRRRTPSLRVVEQVCDRPALTATTAAFITAARANASPSAPSAPASRRAQPRCWCRSPEARSQRTRCRRSWSHSRGSGWNPSSAMARNPPAAWEARAQGPGTRDVGQIPSPAESGELGGQGRDPPMKQLPVLGAGSAGTARKFARRLGERRRVTIVHLDDEHHYEPGYLFVPFGSYSLDGAEAVAPALQTSTTDDSSTSSTCRSGAPWRHLSSPSWPPPGCARRGAGAPTDDPPTDGHNP
jgi:hypothetical protein